MRLNKKYSIFTLLLGSIFLLFGINNVKAEGSNLTPAYDQLFLVVSIISFIVFAIVIVLFLSFVLRYSEKNEATQRNPISHAFAKKLEFGWTGVAILIIVALAVASYPFLFELDKITTETDDENATVIIIEGTSGWRWRFHTPLDNGTYEVHEPKAGDDGGYYTSMSLKVGQPYKFIFWASGSWIHSFYSPELSFKMDVIPGVNNTISIIIEEPGHYNVLCTEYCGSGHSQMRGYLEVTV